MAAKGGHIDFMFLAPLSGHWIRYWKITVFIVLFCTVPRKSDNSNIQTFINDCIIDHFLATNYKLYITHPKSSVIFLDAFKWIGRQCKVSADNILPTTISVIYFYAIHANYLTYFKTEDYTMWHELE